MEKDYSQYGEQRHIQRFFGNTVGRFLEIGAYDGVSFSNTRALVERGWGGVMVEPDPYAFAGLLTHIGERPGIELVNAALANTGGLLRFYSSDGDALSSSSAEHCEKWRKGWKVTFKPFYTVAVTVPQLLAAFPGPYDFVSLDVEGTNWELLQQLPLSAMKTRLICVEYDSGLEAIRRWLASAGLSRVLVVNGTNLIAGVP